jgi:glycosyltransferase involved in cell wall biosynthesis
MPDYPIYSLVIPAFNEAAYLPRLLDTIDAARSQFKHGHDAIEVIVADNQSSDDTAQIARSRGCHVATVQKRCIAAVRNGGAALAKGDVLCFVDADMRIHPETFNAIDTAMGTGKYVAGATGVKLERLSLGIIATLVVTLPVVWITGMDTGVVFCRREDFDAIGGYNEERYMAEDLQFLLDLRKLGRTRGQQLVRATSAKALTSTRKWDEHGQWHFFRIISTFFVTRFILPHKADVYIHRYWYGEQRSPDKNEKPSTHD